MMEWQTKLIMLYCTVCDEYSTIEWKVQRQSNNFRPQFLDEECITVYLWGILKRRFELRAIYDYTKEHLLDWFPSLPSYQAFCYRLNRLAPAFQDIAEHWMDRLSEISDSEMKYLVDSCPIILAKQKRSSHAKVAPEICDKGYNSSRDEYFYGVKLHAFAAHHAGHLPTACAMMVSHASDHDLPVARKIMDTCTPFFGGVLFADKAYIDDEWKTHLAETFDVNLHTPRKQKKDDFLRGADAFSSLISAFRQQIECFFNWLNATTNIQTASKVRSTAGLLVHIFGRIAAAFFSRLVNS